MFYGVSWTSITIPPSDATYSIVQHSGQILWLIGGFVARSLSYLKLSSSVTVSNMLKMFSIIFSYCLISR
jgi:hypothetical protein